MKKMDEQAGNRADEGGNGEQCECEGRMIRCGSSVYRSSKATLRQSLSIANNTSLSVIHNPFEAVGTGSARGSFHVVGSARPSVSEGVEATGVEERGVDREDGVGKEEAESGVAGSTGYMTTSIFDLFKVGPGPSSSHTIGPMKAAFDFLTVLRSAYTSAILPDTKTYKVVIHLHGSLSLTGKGHGTDRAVLGGLLGWLPATCDPIALLSLTDKPDNRYQVPVTITESGRPGTTEGTDGTDAGDDGSDRFTACATPSTQTGTGFDMISPTAPHGTPQSIPGTPQMVPGTPRSPGTPPTTASRGSDENTGVGSGVGSGVDGKCKSKNLLQAGFEVSDAEYRSLDRLTVGLGDVKFHDVEEAEGFRHPNTMIFELLSLGVTGEEKVELSEEYYSIGGGFIQKKSELDLEEQKQQEKEKQKLDPSGGSASLTDEDEPIPIPYPYTNFAQLKQHLSLNPKLTLDELVVQNEMALTGASREEIYRGVDSFVAVMETAVLRGLHTEGVLPGKLGLKRKAPGVFKRARGQTNYLLFLNAYCLAASEENAAGHMVVTAPTSGSSGVFPGLIYFMRQQLCLDRDSIRAGVISSCAIGFLVKHNSSISGAEMGCMGEIGTAASMGAAMLARATNLSIREIEAAAEIAMEHHLGLTCDPVDGYVMIPCIERNPMGAVKAYNAFLLADQASDQLVSFDRVVLAMKETGLDMNAKYRETGMGGLATAYYADC